MPSTQFYIDRDISLPRDGIYSLDVHMNNVTVSATVGKVTNCLEEIMATICQVFGTLNI
jgi:hypothetical protein